jgi:hypothetical protein
MAFPTCRPIGEITIFIQSLAPALAITVSNILYAHTYVWSGSLMLLVYKSPIVKDTDKLYVPVANLIQDHQLELVHRSVGADAKMQFGQGITEVYQYG